MSPCIHNYYKLFYNACLCYTGIEFKKFPTRVVITSWKEEVVHTLASAREVVSGETHDGS